MKNKKVIVIGGGASGIIAAWRCASLGVPTLLLEKNDRLGSKILISGGGSCNITHEGGAQDLLKGFRRNEAIFLKPAFYKFSNKDIINVLKLKKVDAYTRSDGKVFPVTNKASDVVKALQTLLYEVNVDIKFNSSVNEIIIQNGKVIGVKLNDAMIDSNIVILATGGVSYPKTGTTGDGIKIAEKLGHTIVPITAALAPIKVLPKLPIEWSGVSIRDCILNCYVAGEKKHSRRGDILFTHTGISGPAVLEISRYAAEEICKGEVTLVVDFLPDKNYEEVKKLLDGLILTNPNKEIGNIIKRFLPSRTVDILLNKFYIDPKKNSSQIKKSEYNNLVNLLKRWEIGKIEDIELEKGEVTGGGISLKEVNPKAMRSRLINGLYFCGEVLDIAGSIGGYNLQAAYSTGFVAGENAAFEYKQKSSPL